MPFVGLLAVGTVLTSALGRSAGAAPARDSRPAAFTLLPLHRTTSGMEIQLQALLMPATWIGG